MKKFYIIMLLSAYCIQQASAQAGALDNSFSGDGKVITTVTNSNAQGKSVAIQKDGKIVVAGNYENNAGYADFLVVRYNTNGTLDNSFAGNGKAGIDFGSDAIAQAVAIQADGKIVVTGYSGVVGQDVSALKIAVARLNTDGTLDNTFSGDGKLTTSVGENAKANAIAIQPDGKIVVAGYYTSGSDADFVVVRYNSNGTLDNSFAGNGKAGIGFDGEDYANAIAIKQNGEIVVIGSSYGSSGWRIAVVDLINIGTLGILGKFKILVGSASCLGNSVAIQSDGEIVIAGTYVNASGSDDFAIVRLTNFGTLDNTFAGNGKVGINFGGDDVAYAVAVQTDGKIVIAGTTRHMEGNLAITRLNNNGVLDNSFGGNGKVQTNFGGDEYGQSVAIQSDGKIVVAGGSNVNSGFTSRIVVARYLAAGSSISAIDKNILSIDQNNISPLRIFPDPVKDKLYVHGLDGSKAKTIFVIDITGKLVKTVNVTSDSHTLDVAILPPGIYYLLTDDKKNKGLKFVKE